MWSKPNDTFIECTRSGAATPLPTVEGKGVNLESKLSPTADRETEDAPLAESQLSNTVEVVARTWMQRASHRRRNPKIVTPKLFSKWTGEDLDRFCQKFFPISFAICNLVYWMYYTAKAQE